MLAAAMGDMTTVLALLRMPGVDRRLACAHGKDAVDYAVQHGELHGERGIDISGNPSVCRSLRSVAFWSIGSGGGQLCRALFCEVLVTAHGFCCS